MIRLIQLCDRLGRGLQPVGHAPFTTGEITGVHISELDDPTPYLEGGELLLTTGIPFRRGAHINTYVERLRARGVIALGLGLGAGTDTVPTGLDTICAREGVELFVVPAGTPFLHVSRAYWDLVAKGAQADLTTSLTVQTSLAQAATRAEPIAAIVKVLATALDGWAVYLPADGSAETCSPKRSRHVLPQLRDETKRLDLAGTRTAASFAIAGADVLEYSIIDGNRTVGFLAVCAGRPLRAPDRQLIVTGSFLLAAAAQREGQSTRADSIVGATAASLVLHGFVDAARLVVADFAEAPLAEHVQLVAIRGDNIASVFTGELADQVATLAGPAIGELLRGSIRHCRLRCSADGVSYLILEMTVALDARGESDPEGTLDAPAHSEATQQTEVHGHSPLGLARIAATVGAPMLVRDVHSSVAELGRACLDTSLGQFSFGSNALAERAVRWADILADYSRAELVPTVTSYIRHQGQWEAAARELGVHRNSLRHRMGIASSLIGVDIDDPDISAHLWLALRRRP